MNKNFFFLILLVVFLAGSVNATSCTDGETCWNVDCETCSFLGLSPCYDNDGCCEDGYYWTGSECVETCETAGGDGWLRTKAGSRIMPKTKTNSGKRVALWILRQ